MFTGYKIQHWWIFFFQCFQDVASLLSYIISNKGVSVILSFVPLYIMWLNFWCCFCDFLFTTGFEHLNYDVRWCHIFHVSCAWGSLGLLDLWVLFLSNLGKFRSLFLQIFFLAFSLLLTGTQITCIIGCLTLTQSPLICILFFFLISIIVFSLYFILDNFYWCTFRLTNLYLLCFY